MLTDSPRFDLLVAKHGRALVIALIVLGLLAVVAAGWVVATPSTDTMTETVDRESVSTDVSTSAVITEDVWWEDGTVLADRSVYPRNLAPELTVEATTSVPTDETSVDHEFELVYRGTYDGVPLGERTESLEHASTRGDDGSHVATTTIDLPAVYDTYSDLESGLPSGGALDVSIRVTTEYDTGTYEGTLQGESPLELSRDSYRISDTESLSESADHSTTEPVEVTESPNMALVGLFAVSALLSFGGARFLASRSDIDEAAARLAVHRQRYDDWISKGSLPMWVGDHHVSLDSLEDVVDVAIDSNERVVYDTQRQLFAVVNDNVVYYYSDRGGWEETAWPEMSFQKRDSEGQVPGAVAPFEPPEELEWTDGDGQHDPNVSFDEAGQEEPDFSSEKDDHDELDFSDDEDVWRQL